MNLFASLFGRLILCLGIMISVVGWVIGSVLGSNLGTTLPGITLIGIGAFIYWRAVTKDCTACRKRIKTSAAVCSHCGGAQS
jgi:hypothetical protein